MEAIEAFLSQEVDSIVMEMPEADHSEYEEKVMYRKLQQRKTFNSYPYSPIICESYFTNIWIVQNRFYQLLIYLHFHLAPNLLK